MKKTLLILIIIFLIFLLIFPIIKPKTNKNNNYWEDIKTRIPYYKEDNLERYKVYKEKNKNLKIEEIITQVNIGLDKPFYEEAKKIKVAQTKYVLVNKYNYLDKEYTPDNLVNLGRIRLVKCAADAFTELVNAAKEEDQYIRGVSGYRSYNYQDSLYNKYVTSDGKEKADRYSARAGYSEHQTGLALDISNNKSTYMDFESTKEFEWMKNNAHKYGFILRYPKDKEKITGYMYEAWHYRFVGTEIATYIKKHNITYDEYYTMFIDL